MYKTKSMQLYILCHLIHFLQLHVLVQLPCYDLIPVFMVITEVSCRFQSYRTWNFIPTLNDFPPQNLTGGMYRDLIQFHRNLYDLRLLAIPPL